MGTNINNCLSNDETALINTSYADDGIVKGIAHTVVGTTTIAGTTTINFLIDLSNVEVDKFIFIMPCIISSSDENVEFRFYEDTDYSGGSEVETFNPNRNASDSKQTVVTSASTGSDKGNLLVTRNAFADHKDSKEMSSYSFLILNKTKKYLAEFENKGSSTTIVDYSTTIYES